MSFQGRKSQALENLVDKSPKGSIDDPIRECLGLINALPGFFTTSSCSGRVSIFCEPTDGKGRDGFWLFTSHSPIPQGQPTFDALERELPQQLLPASVGRAVYFKFEPLILHVECESMESARMLFSAVYREGFRNSGISTSGTNRWMVAVRDTLKLDAPIGCINGEGRLDAWVDSSYLQRLVEIANGKFLVNSGRIRRLEASIKEMVSRQQ